MARKAAEAEKDVKDFTKYERARMIGSRALQISMGAPFNIKMTDAELEKAGYNPVAIAKLEFEKGALPMTVKRPLPPRKEDARK